MPPPLRDQQVSTSLLDRLRPARRSGSAAELRTQTIAELRHSIWVDLKNLLNTRWPMLSWPEEFEELNQSLVNYGIPDFGNFNFHSPDDREELRRLVEEAIIRFEPRFVYVSVKLLENTDSFDRALRLQIHARVYAHPEPISIGFEPVVDPLTSTIDLKDTRVAT